MARAFPGVAGGGAERVSPRLCEAHGLRELDARQYLSLFLFGMFHPVVDSMRGLREASHLRRVREQTGAEGSVALSRFSQAQHVFEPELLREGIGTLVEEGGAQLGAGGGGGWMRARCASSSARCGKSCRGCAGWRTVADGAAKRRPCARHRTEPARRVAGCCAKNQSLKSEGRMPPGTAAPARAYRNRDCLRNGSPCPRQHSAPPAYVRPSRPWRDPFSEHNWLANLARASAARRCGAPVLRVRHPKPAIPPPAPTAPREVANLAYFKARRFNSTARRDRDPAGRFS